MTVSYYSPARAFPRPSPAARPVPQRIPRAASWYEDPITYVGLYFVVHLYPFLKIPTYATIVLLSLFFATALRQPGVFQVFTKPVVVWMALGYSILILLFYAAIDHGFTKSNLGIAYRLARHLPEFAMGLYVANRRGGIFVLLSVILVITALTGILSLRFNIGFYGETGESALRYRHAVTQREGFEVERTFDVMGIANVNAAAARAYYFILVLGALIATWHYLRPSAIVAYSALLVAALSGTVMSGLTVPLFLAAIGIGLFLLFRINKPSTFFLSVFLAFAFAVGVFLSYRFGLGVFTEYFDKAWDLVRRLAGSSEMGGLEEVNRYQLFMTSMRAFWTNPIVGVGGKVLVGAGMDVIGGHSGLGDTLGQWGIVGSMGYIVLAGAIMHLLYCMRGRGAGNVNRIGSFYPTFIVFFIVFLIHSFVNPTLGTHDINMVFLLVLGFLFGLAQNPHPFSALMPFRHVRKPMDGGTRRRQVGTGGVPPLRRMVR